jgi:hypothetical protein
MDLKVLIKRIFITAAILWGVYLIRDPYRTHLPFGTTDLSSIQEKLDRLPEEDRTLVVEYVTRTNGDVLPPAMADPDDPITARTVREAIELQKNFRIKQEKLEAQAQERAAIRNKALAPLRAVLSVTLEKREIVPREELTVDPKFLQEVRNHVPKRAIDSTPILMTSYRLTNTSENVIENIKVVVDIKKRKTTPKKLIESSLDLGLDHCYIDSFPQNTPLVPQASVTVRCGNIHKQASSADKVYINMPEEELQLEYTPKLIRFADGKSLEFKD